MAGASSSKLNRSVDAYLGHLEVERGLSPNTLSAYRRDLARYCEFCLGHGVGELQDVTPDQVEDFLVALSVGDVDHPPLSAASAGRTLAAVRGLHRFAVLEGWTDTDPAAAVAPPRAGLRLPKALTLTQVSALIEAASAAEPPMGLRDGALIELLYGTGARISEAVALDVDDVADEVDALLLRGKGNKERIVPLGGYAASALQAYQVRARPLLSQRGQATPALFLNTRGARLSRQSAYGVLQRAAGKAGLGDHVSPHMLRHSFATHMLDGGADVRVVQELLGHASVTTTQIYTLVTPQRIAEEYASTHPRAR